MLTFPGKWWGVRWTLSSGVIVTSLALSGCAGDSSASGVRTLSSFVSLVRLGGFELPTVTAVEYTIVPKPGSVSPVHVAYSLSALVARGYVVPDSITLPVFGLYAGYVDPSGIYSHPSIITSRAASSDLGFDFIFIKSALGSPVIAATSLLSGIRHNRRSID